MWNPAKQARLDQISAELLPLTQTKDLSDTASRRMKALTDEGIDLAAEKETYQKALTYAGSADPYPSGEPADAANWGLPKLKTFGHPNAPRVAPQSPLQLDDQQTHALWQAARNKTPFRCEIGHKGLEHGTSFRSKAALTESGLNNQLPAIQVPGPRGNYGIPYEPFRVLSALPTVAMTGPSAAYLSHTGNTNEAAGVAEAGTKPDLGPIVTESFIKPQKIAGTVTATLEILQDHEEFAAFLPTELARSVYNQESLYLLQANYSGGPTSTAFTGLLGISGTLSRAVGTDTPLDALNKSFVDLRTGSAFCEPDAIIVAPQTLSALRRQKDANGRYLLDLISGPATINQTAEQENIWGVPVHQSTQCPAGTAVVMSVQGGAAVGWVRMGLEVMFNPYVGYETNTYIWVAEERISLSVPRPAAINIVTGLPTS